jgi:hypothetical protein
MRALIALFLVGHGVVHGVMWALPYSAEARADLPMDPAHSWLLGDLRGPALAVALLITAAFVVAAGAYLAGAGWWPGAAITAAALSLLFLGLFFSPWWLVGMGIDAAILFAAWRSLPG